MSDRPSIFDCDPIPWNARAFLIIWPETYPHRNVEGDLEECVQIALALSQQEVPPAGFDIDTEKYQLIESADVLRLAQMLPRRKDLESDQA